MYRYLLALFLVLSLAACSGTAQPAQQPTSAPKPTAAAPAAAPTTAPAAAQPAAGKTIKIGVLNPTTGSFAYFGKEVNTGIELFFNSIGNKVAGASIELTYADTGGEPQQGLEQARRLAGQEKVDFLMGEVNAAVVIPLAQYADQQKIVYFATIGGARDITGPKRSPWVYRNAMASGQQERPLGWYVAQKLGLKKAATMAWDFSAGEERVSGFQATYTKSGGTIVAQQKPPMGTTDFGPFLGQLDPKAFDVMYAFFSGPAAISFMQQLKQFGFTPKLQITAPDYTTSGVLGQMADNAIGLIQGSQYAPSLDNPENKKFVDLYKAKFNAEPGTYVEEGYLGAMMAAKAIESLGGDVTDKQKFADALGKVKMNGPSGPIRFDERGQAVRNLYITKVVKGGDGTITQQVLDTVENVSQDWVPQ